MGTPLDPAPLHADEFARAFPALADRLARPSQDPELERLVEGFTDLARRVERVIDATSLRSIAHFAELLSPELLRPFPCATVLELAPIPSRRPMRETFEAGAEFDSVAVEGTRCRFRAHAPFTFVPWRVAEAKLGWAAGRSQMLEIGLTPLEGGGGTRGPDSPLPLRLHLMGEKRSSLLVLAWLHEHLADVEIDVNGRARALGREAVRPWGFRREEPLLPVEPLEHPGTRLLRELMILPAKFAFFEVAAEVAGPFEPGSRVTLRLRFDAPLPGAVKLDADSVRTNCVPVVNAFATTADPVEPSLERPVQPVRPAGLRPEHGEVYAVQEIVALGPDGRRGVAPITAFAAAPPEARGLRYGLERAPSRSGPGADVSIVTASLTTEQEPDVGVLSIDLWATNRALPSVLGVGDVRVASPLSPAGLTFRNVRAVTPYRPAANGEQLVWRVLALSALSVRTLASRDSLRTLLHALDLNALADAQASRAHAQRLAAIVELEARPTIERFGGSAIRGHDVTLRMTEGAFDGEGDAFLFGRVLAELFAHEASLNAFVRTTVQLVTTGKELRFAAQHGEERVG